MQKCHIEKDTSSEHKKKSSLKTEEVAKEVQWFSGKILRSTSMGTKVRFLIFLKKSKNPIYS